MVLWEFTGHLIRLVFLAGGLGLFIGGFYQWPGYYRRAGMVGIWVLGLSVGVLATRPPIVPLVFFPLWINSSGLLAISLAGAVIPLVAGVTMMQRTGASPFRLLVPLAAVTATAYFVTRIEPVGIIADFPQLVLVPVVAVGATFIVEHSSIPRRAAMAWTAAVAGSLLGADLLRLGAIVDAFPASGAQFDIAIIGGAGMLDVVYLSGVWSWGLLLLVSRRSRSRSPGSVDPEELDGPSLQKLARRSLHHLALPESAALLRQMISEKVSEIGAMMASSSPPDIGDIISAQMAQDYRAALAVELDDTTLLETTTLQLVLLELLRTVRELHPQRMHRFAAYLVDTIVIVMLSAMIGIWGTLLGLNPWIVGLVAFVQFQFLFFFVFETLSGTTPGKKMMGLRVSATSGAAARWDQIFLRACFRFVDILAAVYLVSWVIMKQNRGREKLADLMSGTRIVHAASFSSEWVGE